METASLSTIASTILETIISAAGKAAGNATKEALQNRRERKRQLERYLRDVTNDISLLVSYRAAAQHIDDAYVEPRVLAGTLARTFLTPEDFEKIHKYLSIPSLQDQNPNVLGSNSRRLILQAGSIYEPRFVSTDSMIADEGLLVLGEAGSGKSAFLSHICLKRLRTKGTQLPIYLNSRSIANNSLSALIGEALSSVAMSELDLENSNSAIDLYVDGLDEVSPQRYSEICLEINTLRKRFPSARITASCRSVVYKGELSCLKEVTLLPFSESQSIEFVHRWFNALQNGPTADDFLSAVKNNNRLSELTGHPLLLSLMCNAFSRYLDFSRRQSTLFEQCVNALLWQWDAQRVVKRSSVFTDLDLQKRLWLHARLAFHFHDHRVRFLRNVDVIQALRELLPNFGVKSEQATEVLNEISSHHGLLVSWTEYTYGFGHLALQEFLAGKWLSDDRRWMKLITKEILIDPWWRNVAGVAIGLLSDGTEAIQRIMAVKDVSDIEKFSILAHCLRYDPIINPTIRKNIVTQVLDWYHNGNISYHNAAVLMLVGIEDEWTARPIAQSIGGALPTKMTVELHLRGPRGSGGNWFAALKEFSALPEAERYARNIEEQQKLYIPRIYIAENGRYVVSLDGFLSQDEATTRVDFAKSIGLALDAYSWQSDRWSLCDLNK
ncbi:MAG TPA: NACHT domain-containing protein [Thermoanaerobaculia bacterium]|jgi:hypothetical protein